MTEEAEKGREEQIPALAVDPGREKCGLAVLRPDGVVLERLVTPLEGLSSSLAGVYRRYRPNLVVLGDGTGASEAASLVRQALPSVQVRLVDEHRSTEQARRRYFAENPPRGWRRLIPRGLLVPPEPYDDYVAIILAQRFLASQHLAKGG